MEAVHHPTEPQSNVPKLKDYDPNNYMLDYVSPTVLTHEDLIPNRPPCLTQYSIGQFLQPVTRELVEVPPRPSIDELPDAVIDRMLQKDKAYWVDKPGTNAYTLTDAHVRCGMTADMILPHHQDVFPRSYQYDLECVRFRRLHACDAMKKAGTAKEAKEIPAYCRDCRRLKVPGLTPFQLAWTTDPGQKRWRYYPDLNATLSKKEISDQLMHEAGRPFKSEACNWYNEHYPSKTYDIILRKFSS